MATLKCLQNSFLNVILIPLLLLIAPAAEANTAQEKRVALVIGNNDYDHATPLDNPRNDAKAMADALARLDFETVLGIDLDQQGMQSALRDFEERIRDADVALFYYAGHGLQTHGKNYLVSTNADLRSESDLHFNTIDLQLVMDFMQDPDRTSIIILDACRDNPLADELARNLPKSRSNTVTRGLAQVESGVGTLVAFATAPGEYALDGNDVHSPFSQSLLRHIETPGLEVRQLFSRVRDDVYRDTGGAQIPWDNSSLRSDFYFDPVVQLAAAPNPSESTADTTEAEYLFWETIKNDQTPENYAEFLRLFPESIFAGVAQQRLASYRHSDEERVATGIQTAPETAVTLKSATKPVTVAKLASPQEHEEKTRVMTMDRPSAGTLANGWPHRAYSLRGNNVHGCRGTGKEMARVSDWVKVEPEVSPVRFAGGYQEAVATFSAEDFNITADLGVQVNDGEILLVEYKRAVGNARAWCPYKALSRSLFSDLIAGVDYFSRQDLTTVHTGSTRAGWMEFVFGLVAVEGTEGSRNCMAFVGFQGSKRVDGFFCRDIGNAIDASEIDSILARVKIEGVIG